MTIIEFLIYLTLFMIIGMASSSWIVSVWKTFLDQTRKNSQLITLYSAHDRIVRDIKNTIDSKEIAHQLICITPKEAIGYHLADQTLKRTQGTFDIENNQWKKHNTTTIAEKVTHFSCIKNDTSISFSLKNNIVEIDTMISLPKKVLPWKIERKDQPSSSL